MRTVGSSTLRGGQTVFHGLRMWGQLLRAGVFVAAAAVVAVPGWHIWHYTSGYDWYAAGIVTVAEAKVAFGYRETAMQEVRTRDGRTRVLAVTEIAASPEALAIRKRLRRGGVRERDPRRQGVGRRHRAVPRAVPVPRIPAQPRQALEGRRARQRGPARTPHPPAPCAAAKVLARRGACALPHRRRAVPRAHRDPAHHRLGHHRVGQDGTDLRPGRPDPRQGRALRRLRQDGELHPLVLRSRPRRAPEPARRARAALVALLRGPKPARLRHYGPPRWCPSRRTPSTRSGSPPRGSCSPTAPGSSGARASPRTACWSTICSRPSSPRSPRPWKARSRSRSWTRRTRRPRSACAPC